MKKYERTFYATDREIRVAYWEKNIKILLVALLVFVGAFSNILTLQFAILAMIGMGVMELIGLNYVNAKRGFVKTLGFTDDYTNSPFRKGGRNVEKNEK